MNLFQKLILNALVGILPLALLAQTYKEPTGPAFEAMVKAYAASFTTHSTEDLKAKLPAMEKAYPGHPYTIYFQSFLKQTAGDEPGALRGYSEAIRLMPEFSDPYAMRAGLLAGKGLYDRAIADMDKAISIEGAKAGAYWYGDRGNYKFDAGDAAGAMADFKKAITIEPAVVKFYRGAVNAAFKLNDPAGVETVFTEALRANDNPFIRIEYANLLLRQQKWMAADVEFQKALKSASYQADARSLNSAGIAAYKLKDYTRAKNLLTRASSLDPADVEIVINLASVAIDQVQWEEVYLLAQKALKIAPESSRANMIMAVGIKRTGRGEALAAEYEAKAYALDKEGK
jgi:tetratricopeptide (TPR) repeat protein